MKEKFKISNCKKCNSEAVLDRHNSMLLIRIKCSNLLCNNASEFECSFSETVSDWERKNK